MIMVNLLTSLLVRNIWLIAAVMNQATLATLIVVLNIFDVRTGKIMKGFNERADEFAFGETGGFTGVSWPVFSYGKEKLSLESQIF
ncbi:putative eukaryotic translation initiation factor 3 subunit B [Helianthus annuus]|nr:putative eukaryotic translation initiation factor 3 subunit B [Helianthus annuus]